MLVFARQKMMSFIGLFFYLITGYATATIAVRDDAGKLLSLPKPAQRIISLSPHITELVFAAGGGGQLVGVIAYSDFPAAAKRIPVVGDSRALDMEKIITLNPDLLVVWRQGTSVKQIEQLKKLGIPMFFSDAHKLEDIPKSIQILGQLMGTEKQANKAAAEQRLQLTALTEKYANLSPVRLFYQVWDKPLYTLNGEQIVGDALRVCGGENIFASQKMIAPSVGIEAVLKEDPDAIIVSSRTADKIPSDDGVAMWKRYPTMKAVKRANLFVLDGNLINRAGPRMLSGVAILCEKIDQARRNKN